MGCFRAEVPSQLTLPKTVVVAIFEIFHIQISTCFPHAHAFLTGLNHLTSSLSFA